MTTLDLPCFTREVLPSWLNISKVTSMWVLAIPAKAPHWFEYTCGNLSHIPLKQSDPSCFHSVFSGFLSFFECYATIIPSIDLLKF